MLCAINLNLWRLSPFLLLLIPVLVLGSGEVDLPVVSEPDGATRRASQEASRHALERARSITLPSFSLPVLDPLARQKARDAADAAKARGVAALERMLRERAAEQAGELVLSDGAVKGTDADGEEVKGLVVLAVSSSMPRNMIADYMAQLDGRSDAVMVLRGFVGGARQVKPTGQFLEKASRIRSMDRDGGHYVVKVIIDPLLFRMLGIDRVPAVAYLDGVTDISHCDDEDYAASVVVYGAARVDAALEEARSHGAPVPDRVLADYRPLGWEMR